MANTAAVINFSGSAGNLWSLTTVRQGTTGGYGWIDGGTTTTGPTTLAYGTVTKCGDAGTRCLFNNSGSTGDHYNLSHVLFLGDGEVYLNNNNASQNFVINAVDFRNCAAASCATLSQTSSKTSGTRSIDALTFSNSSMKTAQIYVKDFTVGAANGTGLIAYRTRIDASSSGDRNNWGGVLEIFDSASAGQVMLMTGGAQLTLHDSICFTDITSITGGNPHCWDEAGNRAIGANTYQNNVCDGNNTYASDAGDMVVVGTETAGVNILNNIAINACGTLFTLLNNAANGLVAKNNTMYQSFGGAIGETAANAGQLSIFRNNLIVKPSTLAGGTPVADGLHEQTSFVRQTAISLDYNAFYQMQGSGDPGAAAAISPALIPHPALGTPSYLNFPQAVLSTGTAGATTTTHIFNCTDCFTSAIAGDYVVCTGGTGCTFQMYSRIASVISATEATLATAITGLQPGSTIAVRKSYWATAGQAYGDDGRGQHDIHANPQFRDPTRTVAKWDTANGGAGTLANVAAEAVKFNGWDASGNPASFNPAYTVGSALTYIRYGFTPTNQALKGAGAPADGSPDIGALPVVSGAPRRASVTWR